MKRPNAADVFYFICKVIESCTSQEQLDNCGKLIDSAGFYEFAFCEYLADVLLIKRWELITERYPVTE